MEEPQLNDTVQALQPEASGGLATQQVNIEVDQDMSAGPGPGSNEQHTYTAEQHADTATTAPEPPLATRQVPITGGLGSQPTSPDAGPYAALLESACGGQQEPPKPMFASEKQVTFLLPDHKDNVLSHKEFALPTVRRVRYQDRTGVIKWCSCCAEQRTVSDMFLDLDATLDFSEADAMRLLPPDCLHLQALQVAEHLSYLLICI